MAAGNLDGRDPEGILLVDKPAGITSHDVIARLRRTLKMKRIGHAGTLDPMATGLLVVLVGKATKASQFLISLDKEYEGTIFLGRTTNTQDAEGEVMVETPVPPLSEEEILKCTASFLGDQYQTPPMHSAIKLKGVPLYKLARQGKEVEREPRFIRVSRFEALRIAPPEIDFSVAASKGFYVRTLAHDFGARIGCGGHLSRLRRTRAGKFSLADAATLEAIEAMPVSEISQRLLPVGQAVPSQAL